MTAAVNNEARSMNILRGCVTHHHQQFLFGLVIAFGLWISLTLSPLAALPVVSVMDLISRSG